MLTRSALAASLFITVCSPFSALAQDIPWQCQLYQQQLTYLESQKTGLTNRIKGYEASKASVNARYDKMVNDAKKQRDTITKQINETQWRHNTLNNLCVNGYDPLTGRSVRGWRKRSQRKRICKTRETVQGTLNRFNNNAESYTASITKYEELRSAELAKIDEQIAEVRKLIETFDKEIADNKYAFDFCVENGGTALPNIKISSLTFEDLERGAVYHVGEIVNSGQYQIEVHPSLLDETPEDVNPDANAYVAERFDAEQNLSKNLMANDATLLLKLPAGVKRVSFDLYASQQQQFAIQVDNLIQVQTFVEELVDTDTYHVMVTQPNHEGGAFRVEVVSTSQLGIFAVSGMGVTIDNVFLFGD